MVNPLSNPYYLLSPLVATIISLALITLVLLKSRRTFTSWIFICLLLSITLLSLTLFGMRSSPDVHRALLWDRAMPVIGLSIFVFYYHFALTYTNNGGQRGFLYSAYLLLVVATVIAPTDLFVKEMRLEDYGYAPTIGPLIHPLFIIYNLLVGGAIYAFVQGYRASFAREEKNRLVYIIIAGLLPITAGYLDAFSNLPPATIWCNLAFGMLCTLAIVKYHLLDISIIVRKSLVYLLISVLVAIPYVAILYFLHYIFEPALELWWTHAIIILLLATFLRPLYSRAQQLVDRLFYRERYDYLKALEQFTQESKSILDVEGLSSSIIRLVVGALRTSSACLLLPSEKGRGLVVTSSFGLDNPPSGVVLRDNSPIVKWLELHGNIMSSANLDIVPQLQSFSLKEKNNLERMRAEIYIPFKTRKGRLSGILVLGQKLSQQSYSAEDKHLLTTVSNQMAMAIDNAWLYEETRESEEKLRLMYDSMTEGIAVLDLDGNIVQVNEAALRMHGYDNKEELVGRRVFELVARKDQAKARENLKRTLKEGYTTNIELTLLQRDRSRFPAELSAAVLKDASGNPTGLVTVTEDITERKQAEEREKRLQEELGLSSRLASVGELAAGVAHEINNPLTGIIGFSQRLLRKAADETSKRDLERIYEEACRVAKIVENLRTFARRSKPKKEWLNINDVLQKALEMRIYELKTGNIEVVANLTPGLPQIMADFQQIQQVFLNIIMNAEQSMIETNCGGKLVIESQEHKDRVRITFTDDGPGIPKKNLDKLFDPFFTTRDEKGGTGLGLSICHGIVTKHGGKIYARSKPSEGATFFVELPLTTE